MHWRCMGRPMEGILHGQHTVIRSTRSPSRPCGSVTAGVHGCPRWVSPSKHHTAIRDNHGVAHVRRHDPIASPCLVMRYPRGGPLFASLRWPRHTGCSSEAIDMTATRGIVREAYRRFINVVHPGRRISLHMPAQGLGGHGHLRAGVAQPRARGLSASGHQPRSARGYTLQPRSHPAARFPGSVPTSRGPR